MKVKENREQKGQVEVMMASSLSTGKTQISRIHTIGSSQTHKTPKHTHAPTPT